jgi:hypothetical protein
MQDPQELILVSPDHFGFNPETGISNAFQKNTGESAEVIRENAKTEFQQVLQLLDAVNIAYTVFPSPDEITPDAVFPNNWFFVLPEETLVICPMQAENRRKERQNNILSFIQSQFDITDTIDLSSYENEGQFLEGTGSIVFDHDAHVAYACVSPRTDEKLLRELCARINYEPFVFRAIGPKGEEIYHTNVVMHVGEHIAGVCLDAIENPLESAMVYQKLDSSGCEIIQLSFSQMLSFAGNMLEVKDREGNPVLLMSTTAFNCLTPSQIQKIEAKVRIAHTPIPTLETIGGGSLRCMLAGIHVKRKS